MKNKFTPMSYVGISREDVIDEAAEKCLDVMFRNSYPSITLKEYKKQHKNMSEEEKENASLFEAHYLPKEICDLICDEFTEAYGFKPELPETIEILKDYFKNPIVDKKFSWPDIEKTIEPMNVETYREVEKFMDMAKNYFRWDLDMSRFLWTVMNYAPSSNRETVEKWWHEHGDPEFKVPDDKVWFDEYGNNLN